MPTIGASGNLRSPARCNAAVERADTGDVVKIVSQPSKRLRPSAVHVVDTSDGLQTNRRMRIMTDGLTARCPPQPVCNFAGGYVVAVAPGQGNHQKPVPVTFPGASDKPFVRLQCFSSSTHREARIGFRR